MFVVEVLLRVMAGLLVVLAGAESCVYAFLLVREGLNPKTVGSLIGSLLMLLLGVWSSRKLASRFARSRSKSFDAPIG